MDPTNGVPNFFEKDRSMTYKRVAVFDNRGEDLLQHLESCISFIEQVLAHVWQSFGSSVVAYVYFRKWKAAGAFSDHLDSPRAVFGLRGWRF